MKEIDPQKINWDNLKVFHTVAHAGHFGEAGRLLGLSQPTISKHLNQLEEEVGCRLLERSRGGRNIPLTPQGQVFLELASNFFKLFKESIDEVEETKNLSGKISIATTKGIGSAWLFPKLLKFKEEYPDIIIDLTMVNYYLNLIDQKADVYIAPKFLESPNLYHAYLDTFSIGAYASKEYIERYGNPKELKELNHHKIINFQFNLSIPYANWLTTAGMQKGIEREPSLILDDVNLAVSAVEKNFGIALFFDIVGQNYPKLVKILNEYNIGSLEIFIITDQNSKRLKRVDLLTDYLRNSKSVI